MQDELQQEDEIIELIAKAFDEPLTPAEQAQVDAAMQESIAIRLASQGLQEFDALLKRTGMAIPDEGFPLRFLARLDAYERRRARLQWALTLLVLFLGLSAALYWFGTNWSAVVNTLFFAAASGILLVPLGFAFLFALVTYLGTGPILLYALVVLLLTLLWARVSGGWNAIPTEK
jgi:hypothetical protein